MSGTSELLHYLLYIITSRLPHRIGTAPPHVAQHPGTVLEPERLVTAVERLAGGVEVAGEEDDLRRRSHSGASSELKWNADTNHARVPSQGILEVVEAARVFG